MPREPLFPHVPKKKEPLFPHTTKGKPETYLNIKGKRYKLVGVEPSESTAGVWAANMREHGEIIEIIPIPTGFALYREEFSGRVPAVGRPEYEIEMDKMGCITITRTDDPGKDVFLQFESDKDLIYGLLRRGEQRDLDNGWTVRVKRTEPRASMLDELWKSSAQLIPLTLLASTTGDPIRKFCCRLCGECAPKELLEEGRFPDRISWLRSHYKEKHPGMWGKMSPGMTTNILPLIVPEGMSHEQIARLIDPDKYPQRTSAMRKIRAFKVVEIHDDGSLTVESADDKLYVVTAKGQTFEAKMSPMTVEDGEPVPPQYRHLVGLISEPLPKDAY
jgi:hypothetical protein